MLELMVAASKKYIGAPVGYLAYYTALAISPVVRHERELVQDQLHETFVADVQRWFYHITRYFDVDPHSQQMLREAQKQAALRAQINDANRIQVDKLFEEKK